MPRAFTGVWAGMSFLVVVPNSYVVIFSCVVFSCEYVLLVLLRLGTGRHQVK